MTVNTANKRRSVFGLDGPPFVVYPLPGTDLSSMASLRHLAGLYRFGEDEEAGLFATIADIEAFLQIEITEADEIASAVRALGEATAAIRNYCRQYLSLVEGEVIVLDAPRGRRLFLPELPVVELSQVVEEGVTLVANTDYRLDGSGMLHRLKGNVWKLDGDMEGLQNIEITYSHGYDPIPDDIVVVCTRAASRAYQAGLRATDSEGVAGVASKSLGDYSVAFQQEGVQEGTMGASAARMLLMSEKDLLDKFRI